MIGRNRKPHLATLVLGCVLVSASWLPAQPRFAATRANLLDETARRDMIETLTELLHEHYVLEEVAANVAEALQTELAAGEFKNLAHPVAFAVRVDQTLKRVSRDKHLGLVMRDAQWVRESREDPESARLKRLEYIRRRNFGFARMEVFDGNVGYLDLQTFAPPQLAGNTLTGSMAFLAHSDAIIVDLRENGGGSPEMVRLLASYFFDHRRPLDSLYHRRFDQWREMWTLDEVPGEKMPEVPLFILTSGRTFSGAEEFAYNLKHLKRARLIGEVTGGGAHPGEFFSLSDRMAVFIPTERPVNPVTGTNWERRGVVPHLEIEADQALDAALAEARFQAAKRRQGEDRSLTKDVKKVLSLWSRAEALYEEGHHAGAIVLLEKLVRKNPDHGLAWFRLGHCYHLRDAFDKAIAAYRQAAAILVYRAAVYYYLARVHCQRDDPDAAFDALEAAFDAGFGDFDLLHRDPELANLRADPRFQKYAP